MRRPDVELEALKSELEQEKRYRETVEWSNSELERSIQELEKYLRELEENAAEDNEWKVRYESQQAINRQLREQRDFLEAELQDAKHKATTGSFPEAMNFDLDALSEAELLRLVKHLERIRNDLYSTLRDTEWKMDKEAKDYHHYNDIRNVYRAELKHAKYSLERMRLQPPPLLDYPSGTGSEIAPNQRILDPKKGPIKRTAGVRTLPRLVDHPGGREGGGAGRSRERDSKTTTSRSRPNSLQRRRKSIGATSKSAKTRHSGPSGGGGGAGSEGTDEASGGSSERYIGSAKEGSILTLDDRKRRDRGATSGKNRK